MNPLEPPITSNRFRNPLFWLRFLIIAAIFALGLWYISEKKSVSLPQEAETTPTPNREALSQFPFAASPNGNGTTDIKPDEKTLASPKLKPEISGRTFYVSPQGNDEKDGLSEATPFATIQKAVDLAEPGDGVMLLSGVYMQHFISKKNGAEEKPIVVRGTPEAVVKGSDKKSRVIEINHDYITLDSFTVDGHVGNSNKEKGYRDKLIYAQGQDKKDGVTGLKIQRMVIQNAGGECVRIRYFAVKNEVAFNTIRRCGAYDFVLGGDGKNGEGIYVGTAPEQRDDGNNPTEDMDVSSGNWIHNNFLDTQGNECVDLKEGTTGNIVEYNKCTGQLDNDSGGMGSRGNGNTFRFNEIYDNRGAGIRLGGDKKNQGIENSVYGNIFRKNGEGGIKIMRKPQGKICGNTFINNKEGDLSGEHTKGYNEAKRCPE